MNPSRRKFLAWSLAAGIAPAYALYAWRWGDPAAIIVAILKRRVGYLRVEHGSFYEFARTYVSSRREYERQLATLSAVSLPMQLISPYRWLRQGHALRRLEDSVVSDYLLSTDFFFHGADEQRAVTYVAFYDPYARPCSNPFNRQP
jgi:hypothetical protein